MEFSPPSAAQPVSDSAIVDTLLAWRATGCEIALLTVARDGRDGGCPPGTLLAVRDDGATFGALPCRGLDPLLGARLRKGRLPHARPERLAGGPTEFVFERLHDAERLQELQAALARRAPLVRSLNLHDGSTELTLHGRDFHCDAHLLERRFEPAWRLLLLGANALAAHLIHCAAGLGFEVVLCDPRDKVRATWNLDPEAHAIVVDSRAPAALTALFAADARTAVIGLSGDNHMEAHAIAVALAGCAFFVAAVAAGSSPLPRFRGIGRPPAETAVALLAEVLAARRRQKQMLAESAA